LYNVNGKNMYVGGEGANFANDQWWYTRPGVGETETYCSL